MSSYFWKYGRSYSLLSSKKKCTKRWFWNNFWTLMDYFQGPHTDNILLDKCHVNLCFHNPWAQHHQNPGCWLSLWWCNQPNLIGPVTEPRVSREYSGTNYQITSHKSFKNIPKISLEMIWLQWKNYHQEANLHLLSTENFKSLEKYLLSKPLM